MRCIALALLLITSTACATSARDPARAAYPDELGDTRIQERLERMRTEFNNLFPDS